MVLSRVWLVIKKNENKLGPLSSEEIKEGLRRGSIEPFDLAYKEGNPQNLSKPIIEIDELFGQFDGEAKTEIIPQKDTIIKVIDKTTIDHVDTKAQSSDHVDTKAQSSTNITSTRINRRLEIRNQQPTNKKYFLLDEKNRTLGPFTTEEILNQYDAGKILPHARIRKKDSKKEIAISRFVDYQRGNKFGKIAIKPAPVLSTTRKTKKNPLLQVALFLLILGSGASAAWIFWLKPYLEIESKSAASAPVIETKDGLAKIGSTFNRPKAAVDAIPLTSDSRTTTYRPPSGTTPDVSQKVDSSSESLPPTDNTLGEAISKIAHLRASDGQIVTLGPLYFTQTDLKKCQVKCVLPMKDQVGGSIQVKFFKAAYESKLKLKISGVYVIGRVQDQGLSILLSGIK